MAKKKINAIPIEREVIVIAKKENLFIDVNKDDKEENNFKKEEEKKENE